ncbi:guanylate kinase [Salinispora pacifica]|uniref:guanylate kinase n=1 Tax=Salinispora pacifica TaxID=351187 RepID=UPI0002E9C383|nr:guanylate kinase [Salinispora pacifica]
MSTDGEARPAARLTILTGPSGSGRDGVAGLVRARLPTVWTPVPVTTRPRRDGEVAGVDRVFLDPAEFDRLLAAGDLLEWSQIGRYRRGTAGQPLRSRLAAGAPALLPMDLAGALRLRAVLPTAQLVLLHPPGYVADPVTEPHFAHTIVHGRTVQVVDELVGLFGSSFKAPARPRVRG